MRVVADSQAIYWYLSDPGRLSRAATRALGEAERCGRSPERLQDGVVTGRPGLAHRANHLLAGAPVALQLWPHFEPGRPNSKDAFDGAIVATARALGVDLILSNSRIVPSMANVVR